jgi:alkanesulfonate monooxygenase SsuD/methylene tetrahydromethanopterin reductase-like flavin-dependent oxidoreductase (luciferase family)
MPDLGREIQFGYFLVPNAADPLMATAQEVERLGLDYVAIQDHPYQRRYADTWTLMPMIAAATTTLKIFPDVANLPLRLPSMIAKASATLDVLSGGRFDLGLGGGAFWDAIEGYGGPFRSAGESLDALEEAVVIIRMIWSGERGLRFSGKHYRLGGAHGGPVPTHRIGIWIGAFGPRALRQTARIADGWIPSFRGELEPMAEMTKRLDEAIVKADRDLNDVRRIMNVNGVITDATSEGPLHGPVEQWVDQLTDFVVTLGFDTFIFWADGADQLPRFANEVVPRVREQVAARRGK